MLALLNNPLLGRDLGVEGGVKGFREDWHGEIERIDINNWVN